MKKIFELAKEYLIENFGNLVSAGDIYFDKGNESWNVKILSKTPRGILILGEIRLNPKGDIIDVPTRESLLKILKAKLEENRIIINVSAKDLPKVEQIAKDIRVI